MKIVSLQSVGLGAIFSGGNGTTGFNEPYTITVGENLYDGRGYSLDVTVTKIEFGDMYDGMEMPKQDDTYFVYTSDGHIRVFPEDKYIAEWSDDTDRISPDDIGNDIHEFLHGGEIK